MNTRRRSVLMVFLDGVGLSRGEVESNPLATHRYSGLAQIAGGRNWTSEEFHHAADDTMLIGSLDACLGVDGLPQSGTGQATLFTGVNCAAIVGRHHGPYPHSSTRDTIRTHNVFATMNARGRHTAFANAYPPIFFEYAERTDRWPVTTRCCLDAETRIRTTDEIALGAAIPADLTGKALATRVPDIELIDEGEAATVLADIAEMHDFTLFEYFLTDKAGHSADMHKAEAVLSSLDKFVGSLDSAVDFDTTTLVITSDHGNIEDLSTRSHTRNPVPLIVRGWAASVFEDARDLTDVAPAIVSALCGRATLE